MIDHVALDIVYKDIFGYEFDKYISVPLAFFQEIEEFWPRFIGGMVSFVRTILCSSDPDKRNYITVMGFHPIVKY